MNEMDEGERDVARDNFKAANTDRFVELKLEGINE